MLVQQKSITSEFAIVSLVLGIFSFVNIFGTEKAILAVVFGILALRKIKKDSQLQGGKLSIAGITLGVISFVATVVFTIKLWPKICQLQQFMLKK